MFDVNKYLSYATEENIAYLKQIQQNYSRQIEEATNITQKIDFSNWDDMLSKKISSHNDAMKVVYFPAISKDISYGNLKNLITLVESLRSKCIEYKSIQNEKIFFPNLSSDDEKQYGNGNSSRMSIEGRNALDSYERKKEAQRRRLNECERTIKDILAKISRIEFNETGIQQEYYKVDLTPITDTSTRIVEKDEVITSYYDNMTGQRYEYRDTIVIENGKRIRTFTEIITDSSGTTTENKTIISVNLDDPETGSVETFYGERYEYVRNEKNEIVETELYENKHEEISDTSDIVGNVPRTVTIYNSSGQVIGSKTINSDSRLSLTDVFIDYQIQLLKNGQKVDSDLGMFHLTQTGSATILNFATGEEITFKLE